MGNRGKIRPHVMFQIGDGKIASAWYDKWCVQGPLCEMILKRDVYDARLKDDCVMGEL